MAKTTEHRDVISGAFKFRAEVCMSELCKLAQSWKEEKNGDRFLDLHVRASGPYHFIGFQFARGDSGKKSYDDFVYKMTDQLKRRFGNELVGWDISSFVYIIT